ncbi:MAG: tryptophan 7-halogenase [Sphingomonas sp.]
MSDRPSRIVIVGRDAPLWLTAAVLTRALSPIGVSVTVIELPSQLTPASLHKGWPALEALHSKLGIEEATLLRTTGGGFSLGFNIVPHGRAPFFLAHGAYGTPIDGNDFFGLWLKARRFGLDVALDDFSPTAMAARHGRMLLPDTETGTFGRTEYGYHLPALRYAGLLKGLADRFGATVRQAGAIQIERTAPGNIQAIILDGETITGDLFVDVSGDKGALIETAREDWRAFLPIDRRLTAQAERGAMIPAYAELRLAGHGHTALYASQAATHFVHSYASAEQSDNDAFAAATRAAGSALSNALVSPVTVGRRRAWSGNCVAIGAAACALDPLFDFDLHIVQLGIVHLLALFPATREPGPERAEYNRVMESLFDRVRDVQAAVHVLGRSGTATPEFLTHRLATFEARGAIGPVDDDALTDGQWRALLIGLGVTPESWPPALDAVPADTVRHGLRRILGFVGDKVRAQPTHEAFLEKLGARTA